MGGGATICLLRNAGAPDVWILKSGWHTLLVGSRPDSLLYHMLLCVPEFQKGGPNYSAKNVRKFVGGMGLKFLAQQIFEIDEDGGVMAVKNRYGRGGAPPFSSPEEAELVSAANGWPEPLELDDLLERMGR